MSVVAINKASTLTVLGRIHSFMPVIRQFSFNHLYSINESALEDTWVAFNDSINLNMHDVDGVIRIQAYPVVDGDIVVSEFVQVAALPTYALEFDALAHYGRAEISDLTPEEVAQANVIEHTIKEIEHFKSLSSPKDLVTASELYSIYLSLSQKITH